MTTVGIMQGRLSPPEDGRFQSFPRLGWREEFARAGFITLKVRARTYIDHHCTILDSTMNNRNRIAIKVYFR